MRRFGALGLRGRIVGALMLTAAATLAVAALSLLPPLERRLRNAELDTLVTKAVDLRPAFEDLQGTRLAIGSLQLQNLGRDLVDSSGAQQVYLLDSTHAIRLSTTDAATAASDPFDDVARALRSGRTVESTGTLAGDDVVRVALPIEIDGSRYALAARKQVSEVSGAVAVVRRAFATAALSGLAIALLLGLGFAATLVRRLRRLRDATVELAEHGHVEEVPADRNSDEVGDLTRAFATMQRRLHQQEEARRAFVSTASHELRTPVASLRGMLELLDDELAHGEVDQAEAREQVARALAQARRLGRLAADLLDLSRIDAEVALRSEPVELAELSRAVIAEFELGAGHGEPRPVPRLDAGGAAGPAWALADPGAVAQILRILLDNAVRASPPDEVVDVLLRAAPNGGPAALVVRDAGPGIAPDERERVFQRFARGSTADGAGFGLGLAIGRELAERMGGTLVLEEAGPPGATFTLRLPAPPPDHPSA
ncbi:sensor histidine kinase [Conexibacter woesei]|uniref:Signal transduction histidine-protein kinase/phosphatase MprB n=1 Tax=Conexibacter woesei (strain DSM 14684 / CCUG 47730 / CIP 108061 / JCM 11494 / NBRC 100937 / ID131577) TaxID=469383 RepID=D3EZM2_CONWI|nr:HAMP domain-containing sensor histidine kinase [Conexibacter woesei]ADB53860.1 integral membrane sensor signal transduction histidine kinase [Conexibacter woesei DSM 14684]